MSILIKYSHKASVILSKWHRCTMAKLTHQMTENQGENKIFLKNSTNICILFIIFDLKKTVHCMKQLSKTSISPIFGYLKNGSHIPISIQAIWASFPNCFFFNFWRLEYFTWILFYILFHRCFTVKSRITYTSSCNACDMVFGVFFVFVFLFFVINILTYGENTNLKRFLYINTNFSM